MNTVLELNEEGKLIAKPPMVMLDIIKEQVPGAVIHAKELSAELPRTWASCIIMRGIFGEKLLVGLKLSAWTKEMKKEVIDPCMELRSSAEPFELDVPLPAGLSPKPWQPAAAVFMATAERALNGDDMRLGKSVETILALKLLEQQGKLPWPAILICPNNVKRVWKQHFAEWWPELDVAVPKSGLASVEKMVKEEHQVLVVHYPILHMLSWIAPYGGEERKKCKECNPSSNVPPTQCHYHKKALNLTSYNTFIADEIHRISEAKGIMTRAAWVIAGDARFRYGMSGTPPLEIPERLWTVMHVLDPEEWIAKGKFRDRYTRTRINPWTQYPESIDWKMDMLPELNRFFHPRFMRRTKESVGMDVREPVIEIRNPEMTALQQKAYKDLKQKYLTELESGVFWVEASAKLARLRQFASAYGTVNEENELTLSEPSSKLDALEDDLQDFSPDEKIVVMAEQRQLIMLAAKRLGDRAALLVGEQSEKQRDEALVAFATGEKKILLATIRAGGEGIDLKHATILIYLQRTYDRVDDQQSQERFFEEGVQKLIIDYIAPDTIEEEIPLVLVEKNNTFEEIAQDKELVRKLLSKK